MRRWLKTSIRSASAGQWRTFLKGLRRFVRTRPFVAVGASVIVPLGIGLILFDPFTANAALPVRVLASISIVLCPIAFPLLILFALNNLGRPASGRILFVATVALPLTTVLLAAGACVLDPGCRSVGDVAWVVAYSSAWGLAWVAVPIVMLAVPVVHPWLSAVIGVGLGATAVLGSMYFLVEVAKVFFASDPLGVEPGISVVAASLLFTMIALLAATFGSQVRGPVRNPGEHERAHEIGLLADRYYGADLFSDRRRVQIRTDLTDLILKRERARRDIAKFETGAVLLISLGILAIVLVAGAVIAGALTAMAGPRPCTISDEPYCRGFAQADIQFWRFTMGAGVPYLTGLATAFLLVGWMLIEPFVRPAQRARQVLSETDGELPRIRERILQDAHGIALEQRVG